MRHLSIILFLATISSYAIAQTVYKTTDEQGNTIYSDQATDDAQEVKIEKPMTFPAGELANEYQRFEPAETAEENAGPPYETIAITSPANDEAIRSNPGNVTILFNLSPALQAGHSLELYMDGSSFQQLGSSQSVDLENVDRGTHTVQLKVFEGASKTEIQASEPVSFTIMRHSVR